MIQEGKKAPAFHLESTAGTKVRLKDFAGKWLVRAEAEAKLPKLKGGRWHPYRRLFATELQHVPPKVAATLGGWKNPATMVRLYQQPDGHDLFAGALEVGKTS